MFESLADVDLLDVMRDGLHTERVAAARRLLAAGRFSLQRLEQAADEHGNWCVDDWDAVAAEVGAELGISRGRASSVMHLGQSLLERLPRLGTVFAAGEVDFWVMSTCVYRSALIVDTEVLAAIDEKIARGAPGWNRLSYEKVCSRLDAMVSELDPEAVRVARRRDDDRHIEVRPDEFGMAEVWGYVRATDGAALDQRLNQLAASVCADDSRTKRQRRSDAIGAWSAGHASMTCLCGSPDCPAAGANATAPAGAEPTLPAGTQPMAPAGAQPTATTGVVIEVIAEAATIEGTSDKPGYLPGYGVLPAERIRGLAKTARLRPVTVPKSQHAEPRYRPSATLARFIRCRDLTCRWPGCNVAATACDIDHTVPYPIGPTHASNCKLYCRFHHLLKTFYCGVGGWSERQLPDGTLILTSPAGRTYTTKPEGALFFPQLATSTGELVLPTATRPPSPSRGLAMPTRRRTRAQERAARIQWERGLNAARYAADPPPF